MQRRIELLDRIDDTWETGDVYAVASWTYGFIGNYRQAWDYAALGRSRLEGTHAQGLVMHALAWQAYAGLYLGAWSEVLGDMLPWVESELDDRNQDPPYFTQNMFGAVALIAAVRRDEAVFVRLVSVVDRLMQGRGTGGNGAMSAEAWRAWIAIRQGDLPLADALLQVCADKPIRGHWPLYLAVRALRLAYPDMRSQVDPSWPRCGPGRSTPASWRSLPRSTGSRGGCVCTTAMRTRDSTS